MRRITGNSSPAEPAPVELSYRVAEIAVRPAELLSATASCDSKSLDDEKLVLIERGKSDGLDLAVLGETEALTGADGGDLVNWMVERKRDGDVMDRNNFLDGPSHFAGGVDQVKQPARTIVLGT